MIIVEAVNTTGMFSYGWMPNIYLNDKGCVFLRGINEDNGGSNGSGKSSLLNAIKEILFGKNDSGKSGANVINKHKDWDQGMFGVVWLRDHFGKHWRILSIRKWKGETPDFILQNGNSQVLMTGQSYTGQDVFIEWWDGQCWVDARPTASKDHKSMTDAQSMVSEKVLLMSYEQFSAYVCLGQKAESALVSGTSGEREKVIQAVADVSIWTKAADIVKDTYTNKLTIQTNLEYEISGMKSALTSIHIPSENDIKSAQLLIENAKREEDRLNTELVKIRHQLADIEQARAYLNAEGIEQEIDILRAEERHSRERYNMAIVFNQNEQIKPIEEELGRLRYDHMTSVSEFNKYQELGEGECNHCGQMVTGQHLERQKVELHNKVGHLSNQIDTLHLKVKALYDTDAKRKELIEVEAKAKFDAEISSWQQAMNDLIDRQRQYTVLGTNIQGLEQQYQQIKQQITVQPSYIHSAQNNLDYLLSRVTERQQVEEKIRQLEQSHINGASEIEHLRWTERNLKKLRVQEYESAIVRLNQLLAERLWELWGAGLQARFVTATSTTRGQNVKSGLEFLVDTTNKTGVPIELYSGGETKIIVVAMFLSMIELAAERGSGVNIAAIDEIDEHLDDYRADRLVDAIDAVVRRVSTCLIISHNARLLNTMSFDETWTVRKKNEFATIELVAQAQVAA